MDYAAKTIQNNILEKFGGKAPTHILKAIHQASAKTGVNFAYMVKQAAVESSFNPEAKAKTSSATGLYQFLSGTWMGMIDKYGDKHGIDVSGKSRAEILELRKNPEIASKMAAEFASENERFLNKSWGGKVGPTELYLAHFMGAGGAAGFLKAKDKNALQPAADLMPQAARANRNIFFDKSGRAKSIDEVYAFFDKKFSNLPEVKLNKIPESFEIVSQSKPQIQTHAQPEPQSVIYNVQQTVPLPANETDVFFMASAPESDLVYDTPPPSNSVVFTASTEEMVIPQTLQNLIRAPLDLILIAQTNISALFPDSSNT